MDQAISSELPSGMDILASFKILMMRCEHGEDVGSEVDKCLAMMRQRGCKDMADAFAVSALAQALYTAAAILSAQGDINAVVTHHEAEHLMNMLHEFFERETGAALPSIADRLKALN